MPIYLKYQTPGVFVGGTNIRLLRARVAMKKQMPLPLTLSTSRPNIVVGLVTIVMQPKFPGIDQCYSDSMANVIAGAAIEGDC